MGHGRTNSILEAVRITVPAASCSFVELLIEPVFYVHWLDRFNYELSNEMTGIYYFEVCLTRSNYRMHGQCY